MYNIISRYCKYRYENDNTTIKQNDCIKYFNLYPMILI